MKLKFKLLNHPFYKDWSRGAITQFQLANYAYSYYQFIQQIPLFWLRVIIGFDAKKESTTQIVLDELEHTLLWEQFMRKFPVVNFPSMSDVINSFKNMNDSELLGAVHSFEIQQPEVAKTKMEGLIKYYGFLPEETQYFKAHLSEENHIKLGKLIAESRANKEDFIKGFDKGAEIIYESLNKFM
jgi:pyrroloquinoline-quinone synthase